MLYTVSFLNKGHFITISFINKQIDFKDVPSFFRINLLSSFQPYTCLLRQISGLRAAYTCLLRQISGLRAAVLTLFHISLVAAVHLNKTANFWVLCSSLKVLCTTPQDCLTKIQGCKAAATSKTFNIFIFCDFCAISGGCKARKAAAIHQGGNMTDVRVRHPHICLTKAARLPQDHRAVTLCFIARLLQNV